jgi:hypothetical protein
MAVASGLYEEMHNRVRSRFASQIESGESIAVVYPNERQTPTSDASWIEVEIDDENTDLRGVGGTLSYRKEGTLRSIIRGPLGMGDSTLLRLADSVRTSFSNLVADSIFYGPSSVGGFQRADQYWQVEVSTPFNSDDDQSRLPNVGSWSIPDREASHNAIRSRFNSLFGGSGSVSTNTVIFDNDPTDPPQDTQFMTMSVREASIDLIGAGVYSQARTPGVAIVVIYSPLGVGTATALNLADDIVGKFRNVTDNGVIFETPYLQTIGRRGQWWQTNVNIRFRLEEVI